MEPREVDDRTGESRSGDPAAHESEEPAKEEGTVDDRSIEQTVEQPAPAPSEDADRAVASSGGEGEGPTPTLEQPAGKPDTVDERTIDLTVDADNLSPSAMERMSRDWALPAQQQSNPLLTIKGAAHATVTDSVLVVQKRALRSADDREASGADYQLIEKLGEGGMGYVYLARQAAINRIVALKMLKSDTSTDVELRHKFLSEAVVTGDLDHPNIVPIYDLGTDEEGALFYSMKRVQGIPWTRVIAEKSLHENIEILMKVADAVAFAHARGVVHRDLKPENVMLGEFGEVLLLDWGLAMPTAQFGKSDSVSQTTAMGGTPAYMAPEMASGPLEEVGPASDIYLLGAILYEIVTGLRPHTGKNVMKCLAAAARNEIQPSDKGGELVDISLRAMATRPEDRYGSVPEFQEAIRRYLSHTESIVLSSRAAEDLETARKTDDYQDYARSLFGFQEAFSLWEENEKAASGRLEAGLAYAQSAMRKGDYDLGASLLVESDPNQAQLLTEIRAAKRERDLRQRRLKTLRLVTRAGVVLFLIVVTGASLWIWSARNQALVAEAKANRQKEIALEEKRNADAAKEKETAARRVAESEKRKADEAKEEAIDAQRVAVGEREKAVAAKNEADGERNKAEYQAYVALIGLAAAKIDENAFDAARQLLDECPPRMRRWEWGRLRYLCGQSVEDYDAGSPIEAVAFSKTGDFMTGGWNGRAVIWESDGGRPRCTLEHGELNFVYAVALSPDGKWAATGSNDQAGGFLRIWNAQTGQPERRLDGHTDAVVSLEFSGDGKRLLSGAMDGTARLWDVESGRLIQTFLGHRGWVWAAAFCPRWDEQGRPLPEQKMVTASQDGLALVWRLDKSEGEPGFVSPPFRGHRGPIYAAAFSPDGNHVATGGYDKRVLIWRPSELTEFPYDDVIFNETLSAEERELRKPVAPPRFQALVGHTAAVRSVEFDREGKRVVSGGHDNTVRVWDAQDGRLLKTLRGHGGWVEACAFSPNGDWVLSGSHDQQAKRWSIERYEEVRRVPRGRSLEGHAGEVMSAVFSPDGQFVLTASRDRTARKWSVRDAHEQIRFQEGHAFLASTAIFFPDGKKLLTAAVDNTARIWDVANGVELAQLKLTGRHAAAAISPDGQWILTGANSNAAKLWRLTVAKNDQGRTVVQAVIHSQLGGHNALVTAAAFSPDGKTLFTGDENGRGKLWNAADPANIRLANDLQGHTARITAAAFLPDGTRVITASGDGTVGQWDVATGTERRDLLMRHTRGATVTSLALVPDGRLALTSCDDGKVRVWDVDRAEVVRTLTPQRPVLDEDGKPIGVVRTVALSPDGRWAATANSDALVVRLWNLDTGEEIEAANRQAEPAPFLDLRQRGLVWSLGFSPDGRQLVTVGGDAARLWNVQPDSPPQQESEVFLPEGPVASANFSPDGRRVVTSSWDESARIWDAQTGQCLRKLEGGHLEAVTCAVFSPDGARVLTASRDRTVKLWDAESGEVVAEFLGHEAGVNAASFSADGKRILTASDDATARVWDVASGRQLQTLRGHRFGVRCAAFSADAQRVVTGGEDNTARVWDVDSGRPILLLEGHTAAVASVAFSPDDRRVLTGSEDYTAKLWDADKPPSGIVSSADRLVSVAAGDGAVIRGKEILTLKGHDQEVTSVAFSPDGVYALTGSRDGTAIIWLAQGGWSAAGRADQSASSRYANASAPAMRNPDGVSPP